jgi:hypothetical protein
MDPGCDEFSARGAFFSHVSSGQKICREQLKLTQLPTAGGVLEKWVQSPIPCAKLSVRLVRNGQKKACDTFGARQVQSVGVAKLSLKLA